VASSSAERTSRSIESSTISATRRARWRWGERPSATGRASRCITTVAANTANLYGGGLAVAYGEAEIENSILADNAAPFNNDLNTAESTINLAFSLVEDPGSAFINDNGGNLFNQDPQLGPLAANGGLTQTHRPALTSLVLDAGDPGFVPPPATDQRGAGFPRAVDVLPNAALLDMGAVEVSPGVIQLTASAVSVAENGVTVTITASRTGGADGAVSATYATADGTATAPDDYLTATATFNWADQDSADKSIQVTIVSDTFDEPDETFTVTLSNPQGGATLLGATTVETVTILDDDSSPSVLEILTHARRQGDPGGALRSGGALGVAPEEEAGGAGALLLTLAAADGRRRCAGWRGERCGGGGADGRGERSGAAGEGAGRGHEHQSSVTAKAVTLGRSRRTSVGSR
jgi:hypothetical protein